MTEERYYDGVIEIGSDGQPIEPTLILSSRGGHKIGVIQNAQEIVRTHPLNSPSELSFDVYKFTENGKCDYWDEIVDFKFVTIPYNNDWYEATVSIDEEVDTVKHITCTHANEAELSQLKLYETEINTENDIARDDYVETVFYNEDNPKASLLHRMLADKAPHYQIYHVDDTLKNIFRIFSFNGVDILSAFQQVATEVQCLFVFGEWSENDGKYHRTISAYDLEDYCADCGKRGNYTNGICTNCGSTNITYGYGEDTNIYISTDNLSESINYECNTDNVKNCFRLVGGDDTMTAAVKSCNPSMSQYLWYFSDEMKDDMSEELQTKLDEYTALFETYRTTQPMPIPYSILNEYNTIARKYKVYNEDLAEIDIPILGTTKLTEAYYNATNLYGYIKTVMMPASEEVADTSAIQQMERISNGQLDKVGIADATGTIAYTTANSAIQSYVKVFIDVSRYKATAFTTSIDENKVWTGSITLTSYADSEDTATASFTIQLFDGSDVDEYADWLEQKVEKAMANKKVNDLSIVNLFSKDVSLADFRNRLKLYSLDNLDMIASMAESALTVLTEQGVANPDVGEEDIYEQVYLPYLEKSQAVQDEIDIKEAELAKLLQPVDIDGNPSVMYPEKGVLDYIIDAQDYVQEILDLQSYLGDELWEELSFYRREDEYTNSNFISDGLTDSEIIDMAQQFYDMASKEIVKSATLQHTISADLYDLLLMPEFAEFHLKFKSGNWIHLRIDDKLYKLRLTNWTEEYGTIERIKVEFSDVIKGGDTVSDVASILSQAKSIATTYSYTQRQADKGAKANQVVKVYKDEGISFDQIKAIVSKGNTNIKYDDDGILLRRSEDEGLTYLPEQARIYNNGIYITKDAWQTVSTGLGHYSYVDPETGETVETYGIIADTVIGQLILGENLKIFSENGKFEMGDNGLIITAKDGEDNTNLFTVQKETTDEQGRPIYEKYIYVNSEGEVVIAGNSVEIGDQPLVEYIDNLVEDAMPIVVRIESSAGNIFKNRGINTYLTCIVEQGNEDISSRVTNYHWIKYDKNGNIDPTWSRESVQIISLSSADVISKGIFRCEVTVN